MNKGLFSLRNLLLISTISLYIALAGCGDSSSRNPASPSGSSSLNIIIQMSKNYNQKASKIINKSNDMVNVPGVTGIKVTLTSPDKPVINIDVPLDTGKASVSVAPGTWTISVMVFTSEGLTFTGSATVNLSPGEKKDVTIPVEVNRPPVVERMWADSTSIPVGGSTTIHVKATDKDGDPLSYSCGGPDFTWTAPNTPGRYTVTCTVSDGHGGTATSSIAIDVTSTSPPPPPPPPPLNHPPVINSMWADSTSLNPGQSTTVHVRATDPDGDPLSYSCGGPDFIWTAPSAPGSYNVSCTVNDGRGGTAAAGVMISVLATIDLYISNVVDNFPGSISFNVNNSGTAAANNVKVDIPYEMYGSPFCLSNTIPTVPAGGSINNVVPVYAARPFGIVVDPNNTILETNESNNTYCTGSYCPSPPLTSCP